jgi:hypothetical protein
MNDFEKAEFWEGLSRLYNSTLELKERTDALERTSGNLVRIAESQAKIAEAQAQLAASHENRLEHQEAMLEALLEDMRRHRMSIATFGEVSTQALATAKSVEQRLEAMLEEWKRRREGNN